MTDAGRRTIAWFRRDLRLADNRMLEAATDGAGRAWPVFVADPDLLAANADAPGRTAWFAASLRSLDADLREVGSGLTVLHGRAHEVLPALAASVGATEIFAAADEDPRGVERDGRVARAVDLHLVDDARIIPPADLRTGGGDAYSVYTPFRRALDARVAGSEEALTGRAEPDLGVLAPPPDRDAGPDGVAWPSPPHPLPDAGEKAAAGRLREFLRTDIAGYREDRDRPDLDTTSHLSPHMRVGSISVRACWRAALNAERRGRERGDAGLVRAASTWRGELAWREFFAHVLAAHPRLATESFRRDYDGIEWVGGPDADELLAVWREGRTGFPLVDAGMRQLAATGWMHNRARLVTASFLVKDAGLDWRRGESVFRQLLLDADVQQNTGNWQWVAGVGTDAAPYFRIFNPTLQANKFDPHGSYIRRWLPELAEVGDEHIHEPHRAPQARPDYPPPILDHAEARARTLRRYQSAAASD